MNKYLKLEKQEKPLEYMIHLCEEHNLPSQFDIFNAKDELKCLRGGLDYFRRENEELKTRISELERVLSNPVGYGRINEKNDLYAFSTCYNPYEDQTTVIPLYTDPETFKKWLDSRR
jgi:hypothetical protein